MSRDESKPNVSSSEEIFDSQAIETALNDSSLKRIQEQIESLSSTHTIRKMEEQFSQLQLSERILPEAFRSAIEVSALINSERFKVIPPDTLRAIESAALIANQHTYTQFASSKYMQAIEDIRAISSTKLIPDSAKAIAETFAIQQQKFSGITDGLTSIRALASSIAEMSATMTSSRTLREFAKLNIASMTSVDATMKAFEQSSIELGSDAYSNHKESFEYIARELVGTRIFDDEQSIELEHNEDTNSTNPKAIDTLVSKFQKLPPLAQLLLMILLTHITLPITQNVAANLLTPHVEQLMQDSDKPEQQKLKEIQRLPLKLDTIETNGLRFITAEHLRLRQGPSTKSQVVDDLRQGQIVTVVSKERNWIEVRYEYEDGEVVTGWVFTRYTSRFVL